MTTIKELSEELSALNIKLVAGYMNTDETVDYITILELPEKTGRFKERGLVLSTFKSFKDVEEMRSHLAWLKSLGVTGVGFHTAHYKSVPEKLINYANEVSFPLFSIPVDMPYHKILDVFNEMENKDLNLKTYEAYRINDKLMESVFLKKDAEYILNLIGNYIKENIILLDVYLKIKAVWKKPDFSQKEMDRLTASLTSKYKEMILRTRFFKRESKLKIPPEVSTHITELKVIPISSNEGFYGYLIVNSKAMDNFYTKEIVKSGLRAISLSVHKQPTTNDHNRIRDINRFELVLEGNFEEVSSKDFYIAISDLKYCVRIAFPSEDNLRHAFHNLTENLMTKESQSLLWMNNNTLIAFINSRSELKRLAEALTFHSTSVLGVSTECHQPTLYDLKLMNEQAETSLEFGQRHNQTYVSWDELGIEKVTQSVKDMELFRTLDTDILGPLLHYDNNKNGHLLDTLECCLKHFFNLKAASHALYVHPNTVKYRLGQIEELLKLDIYHSSHYALVIMALEIHHSKHHD